MDSGCSRHITGNLNLLSNVRNIQGGYVAFAGNSGGMITQEGEVSNGKITFERVNYCDKVDHNLLSVSQICDKKYTTVFNDKECMILKPGYVIPEDMIVMRSPRSNDIYVLNMNSPESRSIETCFVSKATEKDSILWHRRMGHIHVRKMNYLMANDLVEGVTLKNFKLSDNCIACKKGKQKKKSHPSKVLNSIDTPLNDCIWIYSVL